MVMIVVYHVVAHGITPTGIATKTTLLVLDTPVIFGVNLFVLISGYFSIRLSWRSFFSLMWIVGFYKLFHLCTDTFILGVEKSLFEWIAKPFSGPISGGGWFIDIYVLLMFSSPLVNKLLSALNRHDYWIGLGILLLLDVGYGFFLNKHFDSSGYSLLHFILLYYIGNRLNKYRKESKCMSGKGYILILSIILAFIYFLGDTPWVGKLITSYSSPLVLAGAVCLFNFFANLTIGYHPIINFIAGSVLSVYLIHEGGNVSHWYYQRIGIWFEELPLNTSIICTISLVIILFILAILIDQPRKWIWKLLLNKFVSSQSVKKI